jgi:hypothetical protein
MSTIGFQKPGICTDSWFQKSNGKKVVEFFSDNTLFAREYSDDLVTSYTHFTSIMGTHSHKNDL